MNDKKSVSLLVVAIVATALLVHHIDRPSIRDDGPPLQVVSYVSDPGEKEELTEMRTSPKSKKGPAKSKARNKCHPRLTSVEEWTPPECPAEVQQMEQLDPALADHICDHWLLPPFTGPRKLKDDKRAHYSQSGQSQFVDKILEQRTNGFFIECGAAGGEGNSNSLFFEKHRNWTGVLVEANPKFFHALLGVNRHAHMVNACLSPGRKPSVLDFRVAEQIGGLVDFMSDAHKQRVDKYKGRKPPIKVQCFPLISILKALGITHVDYFSLDIEGAELDILETIPFDEIQIDVFTIEYAISHDKPGSFEKLDKIKDLLVNQNGYTVAKARRSQDIILTKL